jgi:heterodisulfide reductase subunit A
LFQDTLREGGLNPHLFEMANIREQCSWVHKEKERATEKAKHIIKAAAARVSYHEPLDSRRVEIRPAVLVVGAGIAGIQAALTIANEGTKVYLVEKAPYIGGHMAQLDKTFPTLDCASCIFTPKTVEVARNKNIELLACSEVADVKGYVGNFAVTIRKHPTFVDHSRCTGCGDCMDACVLKKGVPSEFEEGMARRRAIYIAFPQAVPLKAVVDKESCLLLSKGKCKKSCVEACKAEAINFDQKEEVIEKEVAPSSSPQDMIYSTPISFLNMDMGSTRMSSPISNLKGWPVLLDQRVERSCLKTDRPKRNCLSPLHRKS